jgi:hypothetical protein
MQETSLMRNPRALRNIVIVAVLLAVIVVSPALSSLSSNFVLTFTGRIQSGTSITAQSGSAVDIQTAINYISNNGGVGTVTIPAGTFNWVPTGSSWVTVAVPAGINIIGAPPTGSDSLGIPTAWTTIIRANIDSGGRQDRPKTWFRIGTGESDPNKPIRFANIKLIGYRYSEQTAAEMEIGIELHGVVDYRIDHSCFENLGEGGVVVPCWYQDNMYCNGVIDHCKFYNTYGFDNLVQYTQGNIDYGVQFQRAYWPDAQLSQPMPCEPTMEALGQYNDHTHFVENCYFSKWRHCVSSGHGAYYVFRYNLVDHDFGHYSIDVHGLRDAEAGRAGGRGLECYENTFTNSVEMSGLFQTSGGCGAWFNNYCDSTYDGITLSEFIPPLDNPLWNLKDFYMWSAKGHTPSTPATAGMTNVAVEWSRQAGNPGDANYPNVDPSWSIAGYTPYPYPHPLTLAQT